MENVNKIYHFTQRIRDQNKIIKKKMQELFSPKLKTINIY
jgi:hypothetical protein